MKKTIGKILVCTILLLSFACNNQAQLEGNQDVVAKKKADFQKIPENDQWIFFYNLKSDSLQFLYAEDAVKILPDGQILNGRTAISDYHLNDSLRLAAIKTDTIILANQRRAIEYEISQTLQVGLPGYKNLVIWQTKEGKKVRVFEFTLEAANTTIDLEDLSTRRDLWSTLCNQHNAKNLINELYSEETLYYNHKPVIKGRALLTEEYQYMNNERYQLSLQPHIIKAVNEDFIFEIGQCIGSYGGKYILIWRKDPDGQWRIYIDSNI